MSAKPVSLALLLSSRFGMDVSALPVSTSDATSYSPLPTKRRGDNPSNASKQSASEELASGLTDKLNIASSFKKNSHAFESFNGSKDKSVAVPSESKIHLVSKGETVAFETNLLSTLSLAFNDEEAVQRLEDLLEHYNHFQRYYSEAQSKRLVETIVQTMVRKRVVLLAVSPPPKIPPSRQSTKQERVEKPFSFESWKDKRPQKRKQNLSSGNNTGISMSKEASNSTQQSSTQGQWICACTVSTTACEVCGISI